MNKNYPEYHDYLRIGKLAGSLQEDEKADFEELMNNDAVFRDAFMKLEQQLSSKDRALLSRYQSDEEWQDIPSYFKKETPIKRLSWIRVAAAIIIAAGIGTMVFLQIKPEKKMAAVAISKKIELKLASGKVINLMETKGTISTEAAVINNTGKALTYDNTVGNGGMNSLFVAAGMDYQITLADGSKLWLNSTTKLDFPFVFTGDRREIYLDGEAYLEVAKKPSQPFIVHLPESDVEVLGTEFNVNTYDKGINKVSLVNGSVKLKSSLGNIQLQPGKQGIYIKGGNIHQEEFDKQRTLSWREGLYYFDQATVTDIAKIINRWFNVKVVIDNNRNNGKRVVGAIDKTKPLILFLNDIKEVSDIDSYFDKDGTLHFK